MNQQSRIQFDENKATMTGASSMVGTAAMKALSMPTGLCQPTQDELAILESLVEIRLSGQLHGFQLSATNGGLVLRGRTRSYYGKQLAQHAVMEATAVPILANEIEIVQTPR